MGDDAHEPRTIVDGLARESTVGSLETDLEPVLAEHLETLTPFDDGDRLVEGRVEIQGLELVERVEAVGVNVHETRPRPHRPVGAGDDEGRRGHVAPHPQPGADSLCQGRLPRTELAVEEDHVTGSQQARQPLSQGPGLLRARQD